MEQRQDIKIDLVLITGDFQAVRNTADLKCLCAPEKFKQIGDFCQYYSGEYVAPVPTVVIGGNHEASNYFWELYYGGWIARNIYFLGFAGVVTFGGVRIAGVSGIYKGYDYAKGYCDSMPKDSSSIYHTREYEIVKMSNMKSHIDIMITHDWPQGIEKHGNTLELLRIKPHFREDINRNQLGSPAYARLMDELCPSWWFSSHLHVKFCAVKEHEFEESINKSTEETNESKSESNAVFKQEFNDSNKSKCTKFMALDKILPKRPFLHILDVNERNNDRELKLDGEWLGIVKAYHPFMQINESKHSFKRLSLKVEPVEDMPLSLLEFVQTAPLHVNWDQIDQELIPRLNPQTVKICEYLGINFDQVNQPIE